MEVDDDVEHGGADPTVTVGSIPDGFYVADEGTGFGLAIIARIAETHGWHVTLTASETGGARFEIAGVVDRSE